MPRLRTASSSSRMPLSTRPHGLRMASQVNSRAMATRAQATRRVHQSLPDPGSVLGYENHRICVVPEAGSTGS
ncbi:hypothetical protein GCM10023065_30910 [Microbacterium laevaniformans]